MRGDLLWVYEGLTQFYGNILAARTELVSKPEALDSLADVAATYASQAGRKWRPLEDTTRDPVIAQRRPAPWGDYQRSEDYYREAALIWLDADSLIRQLTGGKRSLDDFARLFAGGHDKDWGEVTYTRQDIVAMLNTVAPYDWATFIQKRVYDVAPEAPLDGLQRAGYRLVFTDTPGPWFRSNEKRRKVTDYRYSLGIELDKDGKISRVNWESPAAQAGVVVGDRIMTVGKLAYSEDVLREAIQSSAKTGKLTLELREDDAVRTVEVHYDGGLRYPHLAREGANDGSLDHLLQPLQ
jgi:predicted metalloprotease with PDZ domain